MQKDLSGQNVPYAGQSPRQCSLVKPRFFAQQSSGSLRTQASQDMKVVLKRASRLFMNSLGQLGPEWSLSGDSLSKLIDDRGKSLSLPQ